jgi:hypothetical protein
MASTCLALMAGFESEALTGLCPRRRLRLQEQRCRPQAVEYSLGRPIPG